MTLSVKEYKTHVGATLREHSPSPLERALDEGIVLKDPQPASAMSNAFMQIEYSGDRAPIMLSDNRVLMPHNPAPGTLKEGDKFTADRWWWGIQNATITADPAGMANALAEAGRAEQRCTVCDAIGLCWGFGSAELCSSCVETARRKSREPWWLPIAKFLVR